MRCLATMAWASVITCLLTAAARAWTAPLTISGSSDVEPSVPKLARGSNGKLHLTWRRKGPNGWQICYRQRSGAGTWGPVEVISVPWSARPDIVEDASGRAHLLYVGDDAGGKTDLFEAYKQGGSWVVTDFSNTTTHYEDYARLATDSLGRIHLVHTKGTVDNAGNVIYRVWNGSWSGETVLGQINDNFYYHRPDISVDSTNNVHVIWCDTQYSLTYRKFNGSIWSAPLTLGTTTQFFSYPKIAAAAANSIMVVTFDQLTSGPVLKYASSGNGGATWTSLQYLNDGHYPNMDADGAGNVHLVYEWSPANYTGYRRWDGTTWTTPQQISTSSRWQGWPDVVVDSGGTVHIVYDDESARLKYVSSAIDNVPPAPVSSLMAVAGHSMVQLTWTNPSDPDLSGTMIRCGTAGYPAGPDQGTLLVNRPGSPGSFDSFTDSGAVNGTTYYYAAFTYDGVPNYSAGTLASAKPYLPPDFDRDGDVDQSDFGHMQECYSGAYVPQDTPACLDARLDADDDVDIDDFNILFGCLSGEGTMADPGCAG
jgi:hypothetical protein